MQVTVNNITTQVEVQAGYELYEIHVEDYSAESAKNSAIAAALSASNALNSANDAADSAAAALASENAAAADALATASDRVQTGQDRVATGQDRSATAADAIATAADRVQTGLDRVATGQDRVQTGLDRVATAADRVQTGTDANVASTQAGVATTQAGIATTQAGIATTQAGIATTQASNALSSANAAAASATNALNSANAAAASAASAAQVGTSTLLTGFSVGSNTAIAATDSILNAFNKTQGQINARAVISGTPAAGQVAFWGSASAVAGDSNFIWDNVNKSLRLGGAYDSSTPLSVNVTNNSSTPFAGGNQFFNRIINSSNVNNSWAILNAQASNSSVAASAGLGFQFVDVANNYADIILFSRNAAGFHQTARIKGNRLGLLEANPTQTLDVNGTGRIRNGVSLADTSGNVQIGTTTDAGFRLDVNGTARVQGALTTTGDATFNTVSVGLGGGNVSTNTRVGLSALGSNTTGSANAAVGVFALQFNTVGNSNTAFGSASLRNITSGWENVALGSNAGRHIADGVTSLLAATNSIFIGAGSRPNADNESNQIVIGQNAIGLGSNTSVIGNTSTTHGRWFGNLLIGTSTNVASSALTIESTTRGVLFPRMTSTQRNAISSPATGLVVYNTTDNRLSVFNGTAWVNIATL